MHWHDQSYTDFSIIYKVLSNIKFFPENKTNDYKQDCSIYHTLCVFLIKQNAVLQKLLMQRKFSRFPQRKSTHIRSYSGPHFSFIFPHSESIRRDMERSLRIQSECGKNADQNNSKYGHFLRSVQFWKIPSFHLLRFTEQWKNTKANSRQLHELQNQQQR